MRVLSSQKSSQGKLTITLEISTEEESSFLEKEENLALLLNEVGCLATAEILASSDVLQGRIESDDVTYYHKSAQKKSTKAPTAV